MLSWKHRLIIMEKRYVWYWSRMEIRRYCQKAQQLRSHMISMYRERPNVSTGRVYLYVYDDAAGDYVLLVTYDNIPFSQVN